MMSETDYNIYCKICKKWLINVSSGLEAIDCMLPSEYCLSCFIQKRALLEKFNIPYDSDTLTIEITRRRIIP